MDSEQVKGAPERPKGADKDTTKKTEVNFDKPLGSSRNDNADLRDVAQEAAEKSE